MITATKRWLRRNRTNFAVGFGVVGVGYIAGQYVITKIGEARERMISDRIAKENLRRRFQQNQDDCTITVLELLPTITENILEALPSEQFSQQLQQKKAERLGKSSGSSELAASELSSTAPSVTDEDARSLSSESYIHASQLTSSASSSGEQRPARTKVQLWNELKISSLTRAFTLIYAASLLSLLTRVQLNLLGRRNYLASVVTQATYSPQSHTIKLEDRDDGGRQVPAGDEFEINRKYLTFSWWLLHKGWIEIMTTVQTAMIEVFGPIKPTEDVPLERLSLLILDVRRKIEGIDAEERSSRKWLPHLLPPPDEEAKVLRDSGIGGNSPMSTVNLGSSSVPSPPQSPTSNECFSPSLRRLLDETADIVESPLFNNVLTLLLDAAFSQLTDQKLRSEAYKLQPLGGDESLRIQDVSDDYEPRVSAKLATVLAVITREAHQIGRGLPNAYVQAMESVNDLEAFAAVIYSSNFELTSDIDELKAATVKAATENLEPQPEEPPKDDATSRFVEKAASVVDAAWGGFESVWARVAG